MAVQINYNLNLYGQHLTELHEMNFKRTFCSREHFVGQLTTQLFITQSHCYCCQTIIVVNQSINSEKNRNAGQYQQGIENWFFYLRQLKSNLIMITQCQKVNFSFCCTQRGSYMNMFLWLLDFLTPSNNFFEVLLFWYNNTIISLRLIVYYLIFANSGLRPSFAVSKTVYDSPSRDNCKLDLANSIWKIGGSLSTNSNFLIVFFFFFTSVTQKFALSLPALKKVHDFCSVPTFSICFIRIP